MPEPYGFQLRAAAGIRLGLVGPTKVLSVQVGTGDPLAKDSFELIRLSSTDLLGTLNGSSRLILGITRRSSRICLYATRGALHIQRIRADGLGLLISKASNGIMRVAADLLRTTQIPTELRQLERCLLSYPCRNMRSSPSPVLLKQLQVSQVFKSVRTDSKRVEACLRSRLDTMLVGKRCQIVKTRYALHFFQDLFTTLILRS